MKKIISAGLAAVAMLVASSTVQADILQNFEDGSTFGGVYNNSGDAWTMTGSSAGVVLTGMNDQDHGAFSGLGQLSFTNNNNLYLTLSVNAGNTATNLNVILLDEDGPSTGGNDNTGEAYLYNVDLTGLTGTPTEVDLGTLDDWTSMNPDTFLHDPGNGIVDFGFGTDAPNGLYEWQIQGADDGSGGILDITVVQSEIAKRGAIPEPTSLAILGLGALGLVARRRRS